MTYFRLIHYLLLFILFTKSILFFNTTEAAPPPNLKNIATKVLRSLSKNGCSTDMRHMQMPTASSSMNRNLSQNRERYNREPSRGRERRPSLERERRVPSRERRAPSRERRAPSRERQEPGRIGRQVSRNRDKERRNSRSRERRKSQGKDARSMNKEREESSGGNQNKMSTVPCASLPEYDSKIKCGFGSREVSLKEMVKFIGKKYVYCVDRNYFGKGGQGKLYYAYSFEEKMCVAIKIMDLRQLDKGHREVAQNEFDVIAHLKKTNDKRADKFALIIEIYENYIENDDFIYTIMELGRYDLEEYMERKSTINSETEWLQVVDSVVYMMINALTELHSGVMHLDFKLKNAIIVNGKNGKPIVKLIDFGASRYTNSNNNLKNISSSVDKPADLYTAKYCAPEVYRKQEISILADIWSVGAVIVDILTHKKMEANLILFLEKDSRKKYRLHPPYKDYGFLDYVREITMYEFDEKLHREHYIKQRNEGLWLVALACLRVHVKDRPMAFQLFAYMNNWCILSTSSVYRVVKPRTYHLDKSDARVKNCADFSEDDYERKLEMNRN